MAKEKDIIVDTGSIGFTYYDNKSNITLEVTSMKGKKIMVYLIVFILSVSMLGCEKGCKKEERASMDLNISPNMDFNLVAC